MEDSKVAVVDAEGALADLHGHKRKEMLAKGLCFTCREPGHLLRNCEKNNSVTSKKKGKPPGLSTHVVRLQSGSALVESTAVLETLHIGVMQFDLSRVEEGGEPIQTLDFSDPESFELISELQSVISDDSEPKESPLKKRKPGCADPTCWCMEGGDVKSIGNIYAFKAALMLQAVQPYPGDASPCEPDDAFEEERFLLYSVSDNNYIIMDRQRDSELTINKEFLRNSDFMPALWYAQEILEGMGLDSHDAVSVERYLEELGDIEVSVVKIKLEQYYIKGSGVEPAAALDVFEVWLEGDDLRIAYKHQSMLFMLPKVFVRDPEFDLDWWFDDAASKWSGGEDKESLLESVCNGLWRDSSEDEDSVPDLRSVSLSSESASESSTHNSLPDLKSMSASSDSGSDASSDASMPGLRLASYVFSSSSLFSSSLSGDDSADVIFACYRDPNETLEDRLKTWARASEDCEHRSPAVPRVRQLGDVLGNTVTALLDFLQP
ncbi:hypothetical protein B0H17DRAFT_1205763 [Mycena rosella]|uniref:CCHC-type domain-containing protein n=1 Tax=Mycena rosella TaxID=1033263 RepID=A0AAD7D6E1_MYCRO|nr:hypothetical protein B0H17DRAFT_1205763 [Mycena rosella]